MITYILSILIALLGVLSLYLYLRVLLNNNKKDPWGRPLLTGGISVFVLGCAVYMFLLFRISGIENLLTILAMSILFSAEMFVGGCKMFDNGFQDYLFIGGETYDGCISTICLFLLTLTYVAALITTGFVVYNYFFRQIRSKLWLRFHKPSYGQTIHIFFGLSDNAMALIEDTVRTRPQDVVIVVEYPVDCRDGENMSVIEKLRHVFSYDQCRDMTPSGRAIFLKSSRSLIDAYDDVCRSLGLKNMDKWLTPASVIYLLSDNEDDNLKSLSVLKNCNTTCGKIYCHARREGINVIIEETYSHKAQSDNKIVPEVIFIDSSFLAVRSILRPQDGDYSNLPVNFVNIPKDDKGNRLGYVSNSGFKSMILGFGETGQDVLALLYEYGAFVGKDKKKVPFVCHIFDNQMDKICERYKTSYPGMSETNGVYYHNNEIGTNDFWSEFDEQLGDTNYIVVCVGKDRCNLELASDIVNHLGCKNVSKNFRILVKQSGRDMILMETLNAISDGVSKCIVPFGQSEKIWRQDVISDKVLDKQAECFFNEYSQATASGDGVSAINVWKQREEEIKSPFTDKAKRLKRIRQRSQDYANCLHSHTKIALMPDNMLAEAVRISENIPNGPYIDTFYKGDCENECQTIEYLAIGEHIRWEASHVAMGYKPGNVTNELKKTHRCISAYSELDAPTQFYDWLVIKVTLLLYSEGVWNDVEKEDAYNSAKDRTYVPHPLDTSDVILPDELNDLAEALAKNVHEVWAQTRISQGWTYGEVRDDKNKRHPCLVPYEDLPESEKVYDRNSAMETLRVIRKLWE